MFISSYEVTASIFVVILAFEDVEFGIETIDCDFLLSMLYRVDILAVRTKPFLTNESFLEYTFS